MGEAMRRKKLGLTEPKDPQKLYQGTQTGRISGTTGKPVYRKRKAAYYKK